MDLEFAFDMVAILVERNTMGVSYTLKEGMSIDAVYASLRDYFEQRAEASRGGRRSSRRAISDTDVYALILADMGGERLTLGMDDSKATKDRAILDLLDRLPDRPSPRHR